MKGPLCSAKLKCGVYAQARAVATGYDRTRNRYMGTRTPRCMALCGNIPSAEEGDQTVHLKTAIMYMCATYNSTTSTTLYITMNNPYTADGVDSEVRTCVTSAILQCHKVEQDDGKDLSESL